MDTVELLENERSALIDAARQALSADSGTWRESRKPIRGRPDAGFRARSDHREDPEGR
jgi:hypothetical protein